MHKNSANTENKENSEQRKYNTLYGFEGKPTSTHHHNRYQTDTQLEKRALKEYNRFPAVEHHHHNSGVRYLDKTPKPTEFHNDKSQGYQAKKASTSKNLANQRRSPSPVLMCNASKPTKKMPSYKPQPKL